MSWKEWTAVGVVVGVGIVLQIPGGDEMGTVQEAVSREEMPAGTAEPIGPYRTVALDVTGMT